MCNVKELIAFLQNMPEDMEVDVLQEYTGSYYTSTRWVPLDLSDYSDSYCIYGNTLHLGDH